MGLLLRKNDTVVVLAGRGKGKEGKLLRLTPDGERAYVQGVNLVKRRVRPTRENPQGGQIEQETSIHISNLALKDPKTGKPTRFRNKQLGDGTKVRLSVKSGEEIHPKQ